MQMSTVTSDDIHTTGAKHSYTGVYSSTKQMLIGLNVMQSFHCFMLFVVQNIATSNVSPPPCFEPNVRCP